MPKISPTGHGWPVGETRRGREAQGTVQSRQRLDGADIGKCSLLTFLRQESKAAGRAAPRVLPGCYFFLRTHKLFTAESLGFASLHPSLRHYVGLKIAITISLAIAAAARATAIHAIRLARSARVEAFRAIESVSSSRASRFSAAFDATLASCSANQERANSSQPEQAPNARSERMPSTPRFSQRLRKWFDKASTCAFMSPNPS